MKQAYLIEQDKAIKKTGLRVGHIQPVASLRQMTAVGYRYLRFLLRGHLPLEVMIDVSSGCNSQCVYCPRQMMPEDRKNKYMPMVVFNKVLSEMRRYGIRQVRLYSTGEPLLHPDFSRMVFLLKKQGVHVTVSTNGSLLSRHLDALLSVDHVQLSISGWDKESFKSLHGSLRFDVVHDEVMRFYSLRGERKSPLITINLLSYPGTEVDDFWEHWYDYCDEIVVHPLTGTTVFEDGRFKTVMGDLCFPSVVDYGCGCSYPFDTLVVSFDGKIGLCCQDYSHRLSLGYIQDGLKRCFCGSVFRDVRDDFLFGVPWVCRDCGRFHKVKP